MVSMSEETSSATGPTRAHGNQKALDPWSQVTDCCELPPSVGAGN